MDELLAAPDAAATATATAAGAYEEVLWELRAAAPELEALIGHLQVRPAPPPATPPLPPRPPSAAAYRSKARTRARTHIHDIWATGGGGKLPTLSRLAGRHAPTTQARLQAAEAAAAAADWPARSPAGCPQLE